MLTYLPPLKLPITYFGTVYKIFEIIQNHSKKMNMAYANITFDIDAAMNAFKVFGIILKSSRILLNIWVIFTT